MKKVFFALAMFLTTVAFTACENDPCVTTKAFDIEVKSGEWSYSNLDNNNYFFATINAPEITWDVYDYAQIMVYREWNYGTYDATKKQLPYTLPVEYAYDVVSYDKYVVAPDSTIVPTDTITTTQWSSYSETVDYEYTQGKITIFYTVSDFDYELNTAFVPEDMHFRVLIMYNNK